MKAWVGTRTTGGLVSDPRVSVLDHGFTVADGVFETLKATPAGPFALSRHLRRLAASAATLGLPAPDDDVIREAVEQVMLDWIVAGGDHGRLRITYTGGVAPLGSDRADTEPTLVVVAMSTPRWPESTTAVTVPWVRNERSAVAGAKTTSYAENVVALASAHERGASEALLANTVGMLCEGTSTNVFCVIDDHVLTPDLASGCLAGITRELLLEWFDVEEAELPMSVLQEADEVFLTSSTRDVHPLARLDERTWDAVGPVVQAMRVSFEARAASDIDP